MGLRQVSSVELSFGWQLSGLDERQELADKVRSPTAALRLSNSKNLGLSHWQLSGNLYDSFGHILLKNSLK